MSFHNIRLFLFLMLVCLMAGCVQMRVPLVTDCHPAAPCGYVTAPCVTEELTLEDSVNYALTHNPELCAVYDRLGIARAQYWQAGLLPNPIFSLAYRFSTRAGFAALIDLNWMQNVVDILMIPVKKRLAAAEIEIAQEMIAGAILDVVAHTKMAFYTLQTAEEMLKLKEELFQTADAATDAAERFHQAGNLPLAEVTRQQLLYAQAKVGVEAARFAAIEAHEELRRVMGIWSDRLQWCSLSPLPEICGWDFCAANIESCAIANSFDLALAKSRLKATAAGARLEIVKQVYPQGDVGVASERDEGIWYVGPAFAVAIPLFDTGQAKAAAGQAEICRQWDLLTALAIKIRSRVRIQESLLQNLFVRQEAYQVDLIPTAAALIGEKLRQSHAMQIGVIDLLEAKRIEVERKIEALQLQKEYWMAHITLETLYSGHLL